MGSTPPPSIENVQKKAQKKLPQNFWIWVGPPIPLLENVQKEAAFFLGLLPLAGQLLFVVLEVLISETTSEQYYWTLSCPCSP